MDVAFFIASIAGAVAVYLLMPRRGFNPGAFGALLGAATLGGLWLWLRRMVEAIPTPMLPEPAFAFYYVFSAIGVVGAVRVITTVKPVYAALWFILVVLASAGLLLTLNAEFMAFALIIIYGGAILVTYVFVIMLAAESSQQSLGGDDAPAYEQTSREPVGAILAGFLLLAVLLSVIFGGESVQAPNPAARAMSDAEVAATLLDVPEGATPAGGVETPAEPEAQSPDPVAIGPIAEGVEQEIDADEQPPAAHAFAAVDNTQRVGLALFQGHPLAIELAGVILLLSLVGAVVIARQHVPESDQSPASSDSTE